jgi:hypothetical protein
VIFTFRTAFLWLIPLLLLLLLLFSKDNITALALLLFYIVCVLYNTRYMYYFSISGNELQISHHFLFWYKKTFLLKEISSIRIDTNPGKGRNTNPYFLRIYETPLVYKTFYGCTLRDKHWRALQKELME